MRGRHVVRRAMLVLGLVALALLGAVPLAEAAGEQASGRLIDGAGREIGGSRLEQTAPGVTVKLTVRGGTPRGVADGPPAATPGLAPGTYHVGLHAVGRCDGPDFVSAGGELAALPDFVADDHAVTQAGTFDYFATTAAVTLTTGPASVFDADGTSVIIASGAAGDVRLACAVLIATAPSGQCFAEIGQCLQGHFLDYWQRHGGLALNGYPISGEFEQTLEDGQQYLVQYYERVRLEYHPEHAGTPYEVQLGQFGRRIFSARYGEPVPQHSTGENAFLETGHNVAPDFLAYWRANGGLAQFGYPLSEEFDETLEDGQTYRVQYFERARFERHPENGPPYDILLGQLGRQILAEAAR